MGFPDDLYEIRFLKEPVDPNDRQYMYEVELTPDTHHQRYRMAPWIL